MSLLAAMIVGHEGLFMTFDDDSPDTMEFDSRNVTSRDTHCCSKKSSAVHLTRLKLPTSSDSCHNRIHHHLLRFRRNRSSRKGMQSSGRSTRTSSITNKQRRRGVNLKESILCAPTPNAPSRFAREKRRRGIPSGAMVLALMGSFRIPPFQNSATSEFRHV